MHPKSVQKLKRRIQTLQARMADVGPVMRGSVVRLGTTCGHPRCRCARGDKHLQTYFSLNRDGKTVLMFLGKSREVETRRYVGNYRRLLALAEEITTVMMELVKQKDFV